MNPLLQALGWVGESLDKPGAAVRGLLAGRPDQLLNLVPFSDTMGWTDPAQRTSGRDLLEGVGLLGENTEGLDFGDIAGAGVEMLLDPTNLIGGAAISRLLKPRPFGLKGGGATLRPVSGSGYASHVEAVAPSGSKVGEVILKGPEGYAESGIRDTWSGVIRPEETIGRVGGIELDPAYHGLGLGQQMYLDALNRTPIDWWYNSGNSPMATQAIEALRRKGLAEVHWDPSLAQWPDRQLGGMRIMRITPEGRAAAASGELLKSRMSQPSYSPLLAALGAEQALARYRP